MTTRFAQQFKRTGARNILRQFGELIDYLPRAGGRVRSVWARVVRNDPTVISELGDVTGQSITITVLDDLLLGVSAGEIDTGGDRVAVALDTGGKRQIRSIITVSSDANGMVTFTIQ